jgi:hypothetical protein
VGTRLPLPSETHVRVGVGEKILSAEGFTLAELANLDPFQLEMVKCMDTTCTCTRTSWRASTRHGHARPEHDEHDHGEGRDRRLGPQVDVKLMSFIMGKSDNMSYEKAQITLLEIGQMQINLNDDPEAIKLVLSNMRHMWNSLPEKFGIDEMQLFD